MPAQSEVLAVSTVLIYMYVGKVEFGLCQDLTSETAKCKQPEQLVQSTDGKFSVCLLNPRDHPITTFQGTNIGELEEIVGDSLQVNNVQGKGKSNLEAVSGKDGHDQLVRIAVDGPPLAQWDTTLAVQL